MMKSIIVLAAAIVGVIFAISPQSAYSATWSVTGSHWEGHSKVRCATQAFSSKDGGE